MTRQRLLNHDGDASNQIIWFTDAAKGEPRFDQTPMAFEVIDEWMRNIAANPKDGVAGNKPGQAVDSCFDKNGNLIYSGADAWSGILDSGPAGLALRGSRSTRPPGWWQGHRSPATSSNAI